MPPAQCDLQLAPLNPSCEVQLAHRTQGVLVRWVGGVLPPTPHTGRHMPVRNGGRPVLPGRDYWHGPTGWAFASGALNDSLSLPWCTWSWPGAIAPSGIYSVALGGDLSR